MAVRNSQSGWVRMNIPNIVVIGPKFIRLFPSNGEESLWKHLFSVLDFFIHAGGQSLKLSEIASDFACFWPRLFGELPKFLDHYYKIQHFSDHVAKFHGDRPTELGDLSAKK